MFSVTVRSGENKTALRDEGDAAAHAFVRGEMGNLAIVQLNGS